MNPWIAKALLLASTVVMIAIRAPHGRRSRMVKVATSHKRRVTPVVRLTHGEISNSGLRQIDLEVRLDKTRQTVFHLRCRTDMHSHSALAAVPKSRSRGISRIAVWVQAS